MLEHPLKSRIQCYIFTYHMLIIFQHSKCLNKQNILQLKEIHITETLSVILFSLHMYQEQLSIQWNYSSIKVFFTIKQIVKNRQ